MEISVTKVLNSVRSLSALGIFLLAAQGNEHWSSTNSNSETRKIRAAFAAVATVAAVAAAQTEPIGNE